MCERNSVSTRVEQCSREEQRCGLVLSHCGSHGFCVSSERKCDLDKHCGVLDPDRKKVCTRLLTCNVSNTHTCTCCPMLVLHVWVSTRSGVLSGCDPVRGQHAGFEPGSHRPALPVAPIVQLLPSPTLITPLSLFQGTLKICLNLCVILVGVCVFKHSAHIYYCSIFPP